MLQFLEEPQHIPFFLPNFSTTFMLRFYKTAVYKAFSTSVCLQSCQENTAYYIRARQGPLVGFESGSDRGSYMEEE